MKWRVSRRILSFALEITRMDEDSTKRNRADNCLSRWKFINRGFVKWQLELMDFGLTRRDGIRNRARNYAGVIELCLIATIELRDAIKDVVNDSRKINREMSLAIKVHFATTKWLSFFFLFISNDYNADSNYIFFIWNKKVNLICNSSSKQFHRMKPISQFSFQNIH